MKKSIFVFGLALWLIAFALFGVNKLNTAYAQSVTLTFADMHLPTESESELATWFLDEVEKRSNGDVKVKRFWSQSLVKAFDQMDSVGKGMVDLTFYYAGFAPKKAPSLHAALLPAPPTLDVHTGLLATKKLAEHPFFAEELKRNNVKFVSPFGHAPERLQSIKPVRELKDFKGLRVRTYGEFGSAVKVWGGVPVTMPGPEVYEALSRGTIDANLRPVYSALAVKLFEVAKFQFMYPVGLNVGYPLVMNLNKWNGLPKKIQGIFLDLADEFPKRISEVNEKNEKIALEELKKLKVEIVYPTEEVNAELNRLVQPVIVEWQERVAKEGVPGKELYETYVKEVKKLSK